MNYSALADDNPKALSWGVAVSKVEAKKYLNGQHTIYVQCASFANDIEALAAFLNLRAQVAAHFTFSNENIRWGYIARQLTSAGFWYNHTAWQFYTTENLSREDWSLFLNNFTSSFRKGNSRPAMFALFLREESDLQQVIYDKNHFFSGPWKTDNNKTGRFGFKVFSNNVSSLNYLNNLTQEENHIFEQKELVDTSLKIVIAPHKIYFVHENYVIFLFIENSSEAELKAEWLKILQQLGYRLK